MWEQAEYIIIQPHEIQQDDNGNVYTGIALSSHVYTNFI